MSHAINSLFLTSVLSRQFTCYWFTAFGLNVYTVLGRHKKWPQEKWGYIRLGLSVIPSFCLSFCPSDIIFFHSISWERLYRIYPILYVHWYWLIFRHDLDWDLHIFFGHLYQSYDPWFTPQFCFRSISLEQIDRFPLNFIYAFILIRSSLGLLHVILSTFVPELWPLNFAKNVYPLNILRTKMTDFHQILYMCI